MEPRDSITVGAAARLDAAIGCLAFNVRGGPRGAREISSDRVDVRVLRAGEEDEWERFVAGHERATVYHRIAWRRALETLPHRPWYLAAWRGATLVGVLPLFECRDLRWRRGLFSLPHSDFGGPLGLDDAAESALARAADELAERRSIGRVVYRNLHPNSLDLPRLSGFATFEKAVEPRRDVLLRSFNKGARHSVHKAIRRHGLVAAVDTDADRFHDLLAHSYRRLGTPIFPRAFLRAIVSELGSDAWILTVRRDREPVAAVLALRFRDTLTALYSAEADGARRWAPDAFKYFALLEVAAGRGVERFNFGRNRLSNAGVVAFKSHLGFAPRALPYQIARGRADETLDPNRPLFRAARTAWRRVPLAWTRALGPRLAPRFP